MVQLIRLVSEIIDVAVGNGEEMKGNHGGCWRE